MAQMSSLAWFNGALLLTLAGVGVGTISCSSEKQTEFNSTNTVPTPFGARALAKELVACPDEFRPLRVAFVVDNTGSNGAKPNDIQRAPDYAGSDAVKSFDDDKYLLKDADFTGLNTSNIYTYRQYTVYKSILKLQKAGIASRQSNAKYQGIDIGVALFPKASSDTPTEEEMKEPVFYNGGNTGLPSKMTDISQIASDATFNQKIWDMLKFTHDAKGLTPYVTAFSAANSLLVDEKKSGDTRQGLMIFITDGLPTDRTPSAIKAARKALGTDARVVLVSYYDSNGADINDEVQNAAAKSSLSDLFNRMDWGKEEHTTFASYWSALLAIPQSNEVRDDYIQVKSNNLNKSVSEILDRYMKCKK